MISLPGLRSRTGRNDVAERSCAASRRLSIGGMLPNVFPDAGGTPEYNTVDAALWFIEAMRGCVDADRAIRSFARRLFPVLRDIVDGYIDGTRYGIGVDPADGLLHAGEQGVQLTWMDAKVGDCVVTPRIGKPVEINALWYRSAADRGRAWRTLRRTIAPPYEDAATRVARVVRALLERARADVVST